MRRVSFIILFLGIIGVELGSAYLCYECQEQKGLNLACEDNVETVLTPNCTEGFHCIKYIWTTDEVSVLYRGCAPRTKCDELAATVTSNHTLDFCETCEGLLCNAAFVPSYTISTIVLSTFFVFCGINLMV